MKKKRSAPRRARQKSALTKPAFASPAASPPKQNFPVVGIGASAGGLDAFTRLLKNLPADSGMAVVLVQHLAPQHESTLAGLLARGANVPVTEVRDRMRVRPNQVYVIPPNTNLALNDGVLRLSRRAEGAGQHTPIDFFFRSLALDRKSTAIGVVLSGTGSDGTEGLKAIKAEGGITFAQDEESAKFYEMPRSAVTAGCVDLVARPENIARELLAIGKHPYVSPVEAATEGEASPETLSALQRVLAIVQKSVGVDFGLYRENTVRRRVQRRMVVQKITKLEDYVDYLLTNRGEAAVLCQDILISATSFFREPKVGEILKRKVFPPIFRERQDNEPVRAWVAGCSTGEEAYSLAIYLLEYADANSISARLQIFATDLNEELVRTARNGIYSESIAADVSPQRLRRFFAKAGRGYQISRAVRDLVVFAKHDLTRDPPFSNLDLISCRNVLIYFKPQLQKRILPVFHYALNHNGFLVLGSAESAGGSSELFSVVARHEKIFAKKAVVPGNAQPSNTFGPERQGRAAAAAFPRAALGGFDVQREAQRVLLDAYTPAAVVVDADFRAVQYLGRTGAYLEPAPGEASLNLLKMVREGLAFEIRGMVQEVRQEGHAVRRERRRVSTNGGRDQVNLVVLPMQGPTDRDSYFMVVFEPALPEAPPPAGIALARRRRGRAAPASKETATLRRELEKAQKYLQSMTEEHETADEELRAANEEILSANEELQSTNEELETAKEELQSTNEELITLNEELQNRNSELTVANNDLVNLLTSVDIPVVILDNDMRIRRFTPAAEKVFNIIPTDVGRRISDLRHSLELQNLEGMIAGVLESVSTREAEVRDREGRWYSLRVRPYKTTDNRIAGAVLALLDIQALKANLRYQRQLLDLVPDAVVLRDLDQKITSWNRGAESLYGFPRSDALGAESFNLLDTVYPKPLAEIQADFLARGRWTGELVCTTKDARRLTVLSHWTLLRNENGDPEAAVEISHDITERKLAERNLAESEARYRRFFEHNVAGNFLATLEGRILDCNSAFAKLLGARHASELEGAAISEWGVEIAEWAQLAERLKKTNAVSSYELHHRLKDNSPARLIINANLVAGENSSSKSVEGFALDVTRPRKMEESLKELAARAAQLQDEERQRYGRQLHEGLGTMLVTLNMSLSAALKARPREDVASEIRRSLELGQQILNQVRTVAYLLHPPLMHEMGLALALRWYVEGFGERSGIKVELETTDGATLDAVSAELEGVLLRILQEALSNIHRHSKAQSARVRVELTPGELLIEVTDDGHGFDTAKLLGKSGHPGLGIILMQERAQSVGGRLDLESRPGGGARVRASLPLARELGKP
jgi:two-component system, chemotaxis family, CheB/CheR fusion protein